MGLTAHAALRIGHERPLALQNGHRARAARHLAHRHQPPRHYHRGAVAPSSRPASPGCGVSIQGRGSPVPVARAPSAIERIGIHDRRLHRGAQELAAARARFSRSRPQPGPMTTASRSSASCSAASSGLLPPARRFGPFECRGHDLGAPHGDRRRGTRRAVATVTRPAPARSAPSALSTAAPVFPNEPPMTRRWPNSPLWASAPRGGHAAAASVRSLRKSASPRAWNASAGIPMSATSSSPTCREPGERRGARLGRANAIVTLARTAGPSTAPLSDDARRDVDRHHFRPRPHAAGQVLDHRAHEPVDGAVETRAEQPIDHHVAFQRGARSCSHSSAPATSMTRDAAGIEPRGVDRRVLRQRMRLVPRNTCGDRSARWRADHQPVTAVVALAAEDGDARRAEAPPHDGGRRGAGVLHQRQARDPEDFDGAAVGFAHFVGGEDLEHVRNLPPNAVRTRSRHRRGEQQAVDDERRVVAGAHVSQQESDRGEARRSPRPPCLQAPCPTPARPSPRAASCRRAPSVMGVASRKLKRAASSRR